MSRIYIFIRNIIFGCIPVGFGLAMISRALDSNFNNGIFISACVVGCIIGLFVAHCAHNEYLLEVEGEINV